MGETYVKDITGRERKTSDEELAANYVGSGSGELRTKEQAYRGAEAEQNLARVENMGAAEKAAYGVGSGVTLGLGPAALKALGIVDPGTLNALDESGAYKAGDFAGMVAPAILTGGEGLAARGAIAGAEGAERGLVARALGYTPAGALGRAGSISEALAGRVLPEAGVIGKLARPTLQMASRGATEGALVNLAHTTSDSIINNKPLTWASLSAAGVDGALMGGLVGGTFGAVSGALGLGSEAVSARLGTSSKEAASASVLRRLGASEKEFADFAGREGGHESIVRGYHDILDQGGASFRSSSKEIATVAKKAVRDSQITADSVIRTLDEEAPNLTPNIDRVKGRIQTDLSRFDNTVRGNDVAKVLGKLNSSIDTMGSSAAKPAFTGEPPVFKDPFQHAAETEKYNAAKALHDATPDMVPGKNPTWESWTKSREQLAEMASKATGTKQEVFRTALNAFDSEIRMAMEEAANNIGREGLSETFHSALLTQKLGEELGNLASNKAGAEAAKGLALDLNGGDVGTLAYGSLAGHPLGAAAIVAGKKIVTHAQRKLEPVMAEIGYRNAFGADAAATTVKVGNRMTEGIRKFLRSAPRGAAKLEHDISPSEPVDYSRKGYEKTLAATQSLTDGAHTARVQQFVRGLAEMGHEDLATEAQEQYMRATQYLQYNMPQSSKTKQAGSLGKQPKPLGLSTKEMKFLQIDRAIKNPLSLVDDLEDGTLSRAAVKAVKYVYPPLHEDLVTRATQEMMAIKSQGKFVPADKVAMLGTILDSPIDSKLEKDFIDPIQSALAANNQPPPPTSPSGGAAGPAPVTASSSFQTPLQTALKT